MCGIVGLLELDGSLANPHTLDRMLGSIFHRGPDEEGRLVDQELAMGMRRLSIIDLADGQQPIYDESGRYAVIFNGEIYNYIELRQELIARGHRFKTNSDTEVLVHLFEESGPACVEKLRGMFAFAIWDSQHRELFVARDRVGIKPLYYAIEAGTLYFGSELKALLVDGAVKNRSLDQRALSEYLSLKYVPAPKTLLSSVRSLLPGHFLVAKDGRIETQQYWDVDFGQVDSTLDEQEAQERLGELLRESVRLRLRSDVPFGAFLSGGVDSSLIVALMSERMDQPVQAFSVGFDGAEGQDEMPYAEQVVKRFGCKHHVLRIGVNDFLEHAENVLWHLDQPIADQATVATHMLAGLARKHVKMVLTGEGGDELFAGYARYAGEQFSPFVRRLPDWTRRGIRSLSRKLPGLRRGKIAISALTRSDEAERFANWFPMFSDEAKRELLRDWTSDQEGAADVFAQHLGQCRASDPLNRMLYCDTKTWLVDYLLLRGDKLTMANSLEARVPLLDHKLVEFAAKLPAKFKLQGKERKYLLKKFAATLLPEEIIHRKKQGFPIPIEQWLRKEARSLVRDTLAPERIKMRGLFSPAFVANLIDAHESGYADYSTEIWGLVSFEMWQQKFMDGSFRPENEPVLESSSS